MITLYALLEIFTGIGVFLYGMRLLSAKVEGLFGEKLRGLLPDGGTPLSGLAMGTGVSALIQSSSVVTVLAVDFVDRKLIGLKQAVYIVLGANIGTTITAQIIAFGYGQVEGVRFFVLLSALAGIGAFAFMLSKKEKSKDLATAVIGAGLIFVGLSTMKQGAEAMSSLPFVVDVIKLTESPVVLLVIGTAVTALVQSSSAVSSIVITMAATSLLDFTQGMYLIVGSNVGSCMTSILASVGTSSTARQVAYVNLLFNFFGAIIFTLSACFVPYARLFSVFGQVETQIAMVHTLFNVGSTVLVLPFVKPLIKMGGVLATPVIKRAKRNPLRTASDI